MTHNPDKDTAEPAYDFSTYAVRIDGQVTHVGIAEIFPPNGTPAAPRTAATPDGYDRNGRPVYDGTTTRPLFTL